MQDVAIGETVLLLNHLCQPADTPYRASHAIFVREGAEARYDAVNAIPEVMRTRPLSLRAFDDAGMMRDAALAQGADVSAVIERLFQNPAVSTSTPTTQFAGAIPAGSIALERYY